MSARTFIPSFTQATHRPRGGWILLATDMVSVVMALILSVYMRYWYDHSLFWESYVGLWPIVLVFPVAYALAGLYPGAAIAPTEELRRLSNSTSLVFILIGASTFMYQAVAEYSRGAFVFAWILVLVLVPLMRALSKAVWAAKPWWGSPVFVFGAGKTGQAVVRALQQQPGLGLRPIAVFDDDPGKQARDLLGVPVLGGLDLALEKATESGVQWAIVAMPGVPGSKLVQRLQSHTQVFPHLLLIPDLIGFTSLWVSGRDLGGTLALEVKQPLLLPGPRLVKSVMDRLLGLCFLLISLPVIALLALLIRIVSPGFPFFTQTREGMDGKPIQILKLRTMYLDAEPKLEQHLNTHPNARAEWERYFKLKNDPRIIPVVGQLIRKMSLDELPQLINVLKGDMALVGPRPFPYYHLESFAEEFRSLRHKVKPGLTGLWQVSARSDGDLEAQQALDTYYIRNWSPWLDLYILARTVWVVAFARGAY